MAQTVGNELLYAVSYAENFHEGLHCVAYGGH